MNIKTLLFDFVRVFLIVFFVASIITYLWNLIFHAEGLVDWDTSFQLAIILGIVLTWEMSRKRQQTD